VEEIVAATTAQEERLQRQVEQLTQQCAELTKQVKSMAESMETLASTKNLMRHQPDTLRKDFRPTLPMVRHQQNHVSQMCNEDLLLLSELGRHSAHKERLLREIMEVDKVGWEQAHHKLYEMDDYNERYYWLQSMPYRIGILLASFGAVGSSAFVFWPPAAEWFGDTFAREDLPEGCEKVSDLTLLQVGSWTWGWMEPLMGTLSFVLLCFQFSRSCMWKLNMRPYTELMQRQRANRLASHYPQYDVGIVRNWAKHLPMVDATFFPSYRRKLGFKAV
jgi:hypothetical protein